MADPGSGGPVPVGLSHAVYRKMQRRKKVEKSISNYQDYHKVNVTHFTAHLVGQTGHRIRMFTCLLASGMRNTIHDTNGPSSLVEVDQEFSSRTGSSS